jgi:uracil-DNA glycosylase
MTSGGSAIDLFEAVPESWKPHFEDCRGALDHVSQFLSEQRASGRKWQPSVERIFLPLELTKPGEFSVCLVGQDPYPQPKVPTGLPFSVHGASFPESLKVIFQELIRDWPPQGGVCPSSGSLEPCARFCLMWNAAPTCELDKPSSHKSCGWEDVTRHLIREIVRCTRDGVWKNQGMIFICWGHRATRLVVGSPLGTPKYPVIASNHPSPRARGRGIPFSGSSPFSRAFEYATELRLRPRVDWTLTPD